MTTPTYASAINGWTAPAIPGATPLDYYAGPAGVCPGGGEFAAAVLFRIAGRDLGGAGEVVQLWSNADIPGFRGWLIGLNLLSQGNLGIRAEYGDGAGVFNTLGPMGPATRSGLICAVMSVRSDVGAGNFPSSLFVNGLRVFNSNFATGPAASQAQPLVGVRNNPGGAPAGFDAAARGIQILGVSYLSSALGATDVAEAAAAAEHFEACQRATDMAKLNAGAPVAVDWTNRWTVREGAVQAGNGTTAPAIWLPSAGSANLTRVTDLPGSANLVIETPTNANWF